MEKMNQTNETLALARAIAGAVKKEGGRAYLVGGFVRDTLLGRPSKDIDLEVYGITPARLKELLTSFGEPYTRGAAFGVLGLRHSDIDIAMPRKEKAVGGGHKDFEVFVDPFLPEAQACRRRDFTVNALMLDPLTEEVIDHVHGQEDLKAGVLRHVCAQSFPEDPLRVFRAARFSAVLGFTLAEETVSLCRDIDVSALSRERVMEETSRALLKAEKPSVYFRALETMGQLGCFFPEIQALIGAKQSPKHHPEGDVFTHVMGVVDGGAGLREQAKEPLFFMLSCLLHDCGKPVSAVINSEGLVSCPNHAINGVPVAEKALGRLTNDKRMIAYVLDMVKNHMEPLVLFRENKAPALTRSLLDASVCPEDLLLLTEADDRGKGKPKKPEKAVFWQERYNDYLAWRVQPRVTGADLIAAGYAPGEEMGLLLARTYAWSLSGLSREESLRRLAEEKKL